ncbi:hypothetical protein [Duffyella gerundensis]|uniref:hypothetical protein n=1 Tax=Duffyella gerundensis TaxID=1619313 RepID=UPI0016545740|nr:hypothetical protein [Duffyella gerundensis]
MQKIKTYTISIKDTDSSDLGEIKKVFEENASLFNAHFLSTYGGDARYSVIAGSFKVIGITEDFLEFTAQINFFAGCNDQNEVFDVDSCIDYEIDEDQITFELDETVWHTE